MTAIAALNARMRTNAQLYFETGLGYSCSCQPTGGCGNPCETRMRVSGQGQAGGLAVSGDVGQPHAGAEVMACHRGAGLIDKK